MRPSHWILISCAAFATVVTATGSWGRVFAGPRVDHWVDQRGEQALRNVERGRPVELFGAVMDRRGYPVVGAEVRVANVDARAETDVDGRFVLTVNGRRSHVIEIEADGLSCGTTHVAVPGEPVFVVMHDATPWQREASDSPPKQSWPVGEGWLKDETGREVAFGRVSVVETGTTVIADQHGCYRIPLPLDSDITLIAGDGEGRVARSRTFKPSRRSGLVPVADLVVAEGRSVSGYVRDESGRVCDGAVVVAQSGAVRRIAVTGRSGYFWIEGLCDGATYDLTVLPHRGRLAATESLKLNSDVDRDLMLHRTEDRRFRVVRDRSAAPVDQAHVVARHGLLSAYGQADSEGWVSLPGILPSTVVRSREFAFDVRDQRLDALEVRRVRDESIIVGE